MIETPSNPLNTLVDIALVRRIADEIGDGAGPCGRSSSATTPCSARSSRSRSQHGADISIYSLTKYVGGHSDLIAGAALGSAELMHAGARCCARRSARSSTRIPCWMIGRSLETLSPAHERGQPQRARSSRNSWPSTRRVAKVASPAPICREGSRGAAGLRRRNATAPGSTFSFDMKRRRGGGLPGPQRAADLQARGQPRRHRIADLPSGLDDPFRRAEGDARPPRRHRRDDPRLDRHRASGRPRRRPGAGARAIGVRGGRGVASPARGERSWTRVWPRSVLCVQAGKTRLAQAASLRSRRG